MGLREFLAYRHSGPLAAAEDEAAEQRIPTSRLILATALILGVALILRVGFVASQDGYVPAGDAADFDRHAVSIATEGQYPPSSIGKKGGPAAFRPPGYPHALAAVYSVTGVADSASRFAVGRYFSALLGVTTVGLIGLVAWHIWGPLVALVGMALAAVYPPLVTIGSAMLSEPLMITVMFGGVAAMLQHRRSRLLRWALLAGVFAGIAALTRTNGGLVIPILAAGIWSRPLFSRASLVPLATFLATTALVLLPWTIRNARAFGEFIPVSTQSGLTIAGTYNEVSQEDPAHPAAWRAPTMPPYGELLRRDDLDQAELENRFGSLALDYVREHPSYLLKVGYWNTVRLLGLAGPGVEHPAAPETGMGTLTSDIDVYAFYLLALAALAAVIAGVARGTPRFVWALPVFLGLSLVFVIAYMRYRLPIDPFLILLVAAGVVRLAGKFGWVAVGPLARG